MLRFINYNLNRRLVEQLADRYQKDIDFDFYLYTLPFKYDYPVESKDGRVNDYYWRDYYYNVIDFANTLLPGRIALYLNKESFIDEEVLKQFYVDKLHINNFIVKTKEQFDYINSVIDDANVMYFSVKKKNKKVKIIDSDNRADTCSYICNNYPNTIIVIGEGDTYITRDIELNIPYLYLSELNINTERLKEQLSDYSFFEPQLFSEKQIANSDIKINTNSFKRLYLDPAIDTIIFYCSSIDRVKDLLKEFSDYELNICSMKNGQFYEEEVWV